MSEHISGFSWLDSGFSVCLEATSQTTASRTHRKVAAAAKGSSVFSVEKTHKENFVKVSVSWNGCLRSSNPAHRNLVPALRHLPSLLTTRRTKSQISSCYAGFFRTLCPLVGAASPVTLKRELDARLPQPSAGRPDRKSSSHPQGQVLACLLPGLSMTLL